MLGIKNVGIGDNFFDLGGHSLLAVQLFAQIQKIFGKDLPLTTLFQAPTIEQLADVLRQEGWSSPWSSLVPMQHRGSKPPFFCVHGCGGIVFHMQGFARHLFPEQPFYGLKAQGLEKGQTPHSRIEDMAAFYIKEIQTVQPDGPYYLGSTGRGSAVVLEIAQQFKSQGQNVVFLALINAGALPRIYQIIVLSVAYMADPLSISLIVWLTLCATNHYCHMSSIHFSIEFSSIGTFHGDLYP